MKNKHLLFAIALVLTAGFSGFSQVNSGGQIEATGENGLAVTGEEAMNPESWVKSRRVNQKTGTIEIADYVRAQNQVRNLMKKGTNALNLSWEELGPNNIGGRTRAFLIDKDNSDLVFAGSTSGGMWKSTTGGSSWEKVVSGDGSLFQNNVVSTISQAPNGDIYFGTGEGLARADGQPDNAYFGFNGQGIWKSTDRGATFSRLTSTWDTPEAQEAFVWVNGLSTSPADANKVYAATRMGLRMSTDGGQSWTNPIPDNEEVAQDVAIGPDGSVMASVGNIAYRSANGDANSFVKKSEIDGSEMGLINEQDISRLKFAYSPTDANYVYCVAATTQYNSNGTVGSNYLDNVYQSTDNGETWKVIGPGGSSLFRPIGRYGFYNIAIAVDPSNPEFIMIGGDDLFSWSYATGWEQITINEPTALPNRGFYIHINQHVIVFNQKDPKTIYVGTNGGVALTNNKGQTWRTMNKNYNVTQYFSVAFSNIGEILGGSLDNGILYIDYQGNDPMYANWWGGGLFSSFNGYRHGGEVAISQIDPNIKWYSTPGGTLHRRLITEDQVTTRAGYYPYANGGAWLTPIALWENWNDPLSWDSTLFVADRDYEAGETIVVESLIGKRPLRKVLESPLATGESIKIQDTYQAMIAVGKNGNAGIKVNRKGLSVRAEYQNLFYTIQDRTITETADIPIEMAFSKDGNYMYTCFWDDSDENYTLYRISNIENARSRSTMDTQTGFDPITGLPTYVVVTEVIGQFDQIVTSINVDPTNPNNVIVTTGNYGNDNFIYLSTNATTAADSTMAFISIQGNLPQAPVYDAMFNYRDHNEVIIGTEFGVWSTKDVFSGQPSWSSENQNGMEIIPVFELTQQQLENNAEWGIENHGTIYAATFGRGIWKSETFSTKGITSNPVLSLNNTTIQVGVMPNPLSNFGQISYYVDSESAVEFQVYDLTGKMVKTIQQSASTQGQHQLSFDASDLESGTYLIKMNASGQTTSAKFMVR